VCVLGIIIINTQVSKDCHYQSREQEEEEEERTKE
jgi:hypothetical protein